MKLTLEEMIVVTSLSETPTKKSDVIYNALQLLSNPKTDYSKINQTIDGLVSWGVVEKTPSNFYRLSPEGKKLRKENYQDLQILMLKLHQAIELCST